MSRSGFAARFTALVGESPMRYLTEWRMHLARLELKDTPSSLAEVAERFGYGSEAAFCKAYRRVFGASPARDRRSG